MADALREAPDIICFTQLSWGSLVERPQQLMTRFARERRVFVVEAPELGDGPAKLSVRPCESGVVVATPHLPREMARSAAIAVERQMIDLLLREHEIERYVLWYDRPMALAASEHLGPLAVVYDCAEAPTRVPPWVREAEARLIARADLVFTGSVSLQEAMRSLHPNVHVYPSSVDTDHFALARGRSSDPADQAAIPHPRIGYLGPTGEQLDLDLVEQVAELRPDFQIVLLGPPLEIDAASVLRLPNVHRLGSKPYADLPRYLAGWDLGWMPLLRNQATQHLGSLQTMQYLAAGRPLLSTAIGDVVHPYGESGLVSIASDPEGVVAAVRFYLERDRDAHLRWLRRVDQLLSTGSWDRTFRAMQTLLDATLPELVSEEEIEDEDEVTARFLPHDAQPAL